MDYKYHGIILSKFDVAETDRIYTVYTLESGKIRLPAIGVKKPNAKLAGSLEPVTYAEIFCARSRGKGKITGVITVDNFSSLKGDISTLEKVFGAFRIFDRLVTEEEKDEKTFNLLLDYLQATERVSVERNDDFKKEIFTLGFIFKLLENLGYGLEIKECASCGKKLIPGGNYFSVAAGGILCLACSLKESRKIKIEDDAIKFIRIILENKLSNLGKIKTSEESVKNLKIIASEAVKWTAS